MVYNGDSANFIFDICKLLGTEILCNKIKMFLFNDWIKKYKLKCKKYEMALAIS